MKTQRLLMTMLALIAIPGIAAFAAGGAGGIGFGVQHFDPEYSSANLFLQYATGYGYGVSREGERIGGFGTGFYSDNGQAAGGVGGIIVGHEWKGGPFTAALTFWGGIGVATRKVSTTPPAVVLFGEADAELGIRLVRWMQLTAYVGMQGWGRPFHQIFFDGAGLYTPVYGFRIGWGSF
jgi:hypothetical protein